LGLKFPGAVNKMTALASFSLLNTGGLKMLRSTLIALGGVLLGILLIFPVTSIAQDRGAAGPAGPKRDQMLGRQGDIENRNRQLELLSEPGKIKTLTVEEQKFIASQIFEDFERVQVINREMTKATSNLDNDSYKLIASLAEEMNKRAKRLKTNLNIPDLEKDKKESESLKEMDAAELKASVQSLNSSVKSFVTSPVFTNPRVTTVGNLQAIRRDISNVIELSRTVKKASTKLQN
jgi:hypothetical protein